MWREPYSDATLLALRLILAVAGIIACDSQGFAQVSLREKIGQMLMVTITGDSVESSSPSIDTAKTDLAEGLIGGVILFNWSGNLESPDQIAHFTRELQLRAHTPLLLAIDQEGGRVARLKASNGFDATPSAYDMGTTVNQEWFTRLSASQMATWFTATGLNMNLAPVVDVNVNPLSPAIGALGRSFSADPDTVAAHAGWFIDEFRLSGVITTLKHFPGHGSAIGDSHLGFTDVTATWSPMELEPYERLLSENAVDVIMTAHVYNAQLDSLHPATLSAATIGGLLRTQLGYNGVVVSDEMSMEAISQFYGIDQAAELAVNAGVDILLYNKNLDSTGNSLARRITDLIERRVAEGAIPEARIEESYARIMSLKGRYLTEVPVQVVGSLPDGFRLNNYPNPFNAGTTIEYEVPVRGPVSLRIYNVLGQLVEILLEDERPAGIERVYWNPTRLPSGMYLCRFEFNGRSTTRSIILVK